MPLKRVAEFTVTAEGPGEGQRDAWRTEQPVKLTDDYKVEFTAVAGMSGKVIRYTLSDLRELVETMDEVAHERRARS